MNGENKTKTNIALNIGTLVALLIALIVGSLIATDMYSIVKKLEIQNKANGDAVNQTLNQLVELQHTNNMRGNDSLILFRAVLEGLETSSNQTFANQEVFFKPYFNESFGKIFKALNITD